MKITGIGNTPPEPKYLPPGRTVPPQSTVDYFASQAVPQEVMKHVGEYFSSSPIAIAARKLKQTRRVSVNGLGEPTFEVDALGMAAVTTVILLSGVALYQTGKAMAPNKKSESNWGWTAIPVGLFFNIWGLGIMGAVANSKK